MSKKGVSTVIIPIAAIVFTASVILIWLMFFAIPGIGNVATTEYKIGSETRNGDEFLNTVSQLNFLRTKTSPGKSVTELMQGLFAAKQKKDVAEFERIHKELEENSKKYTAAFEKRCILLELEDEKKEILWTTTSEICRSYGAAAFDDASTTYIPIPTEEPGKDMIFVQRFGLIR